MFTMHKLIRGVGLTLLGMGLFAAPVLAQSADPDKPTVLTSATITGNSTGGLSDEKVSYYAFDVTKGTLTLTLDVTPMDKSDGGGLVEWTMLDTKFNNLKYDNLSAQGSAARQVKDLPVTVKRRIIMKLVVSGNIDYKLKLSGNATKLALQQEAKKVTYLQSSR